jgi:hypothetical protein
MNLYGDGYTRYQLERNAVRKLVRRIYLRSAAAALRGPTVDFGCGIGELLERLPSGSVGLEINPISVAYCASQGLTAFLYDGECDDWSLGVLDRRHGLESLVISHVLEHLTQPMQKLSALLRACNRLGISQVLVIVPGRRGYESDDTHRTYIDFAMLSDPSVVTGTDFTFASGRYFPGNIRVLGDFFSHHELQVSFRRMQI